MALFRFRHPKWIAWRTDSFAARSINQGGFVPRQLLEGETAFIFPLHSLKLLAAFGFISATRSRRRYFFRQLGVDKGDRSNNDRRSEQCNQSQFFASEKAPSKTATTGLTGAGGTLAGSQ